MSSVLIQKDFYKAGHPQMFPNDTIKMYNNLTPRKSRMKGVNAVVVATLQYFILEYLIKQWNRDFFIWTKSERETTHMRMPLTSDMNKAKIKIIAKYKRMMDNTLGKDTVPTKHLEDLWDLGYLPLEIKALPEGTLCPIGVPLLTYTNTHPVGYFLPGMLETILSTSVWQGITSATIANEYKKILTRYAIETTGDDSFVQFQGHDFSMRGMSSLESAKISGAGHLLSFVGTDTIPAIEFLEDYYGADVEKELVGTSVPATEHSVMCMGTQGDELGTFSRLLDIYPSGILSVVSDTWNLWEVLTDYLPKLKDKILARDGKLVIRPDSGDPVDIICGTVKPIHFETWEMVRKNFNPQEKGVVELLWDTFGGTIVKGDDGKDYKLLDSHIGCIYGDGIGLHNLEEICRRLKAKGFATTNVVFGFGSYGYQYNTRDTFGFAVKATYGEVKECTNCDGGPCDLTCRHTKIDSREIWKDPITDDGTKKSAKGLLRVDYDEDGQITLYDRQTEEQEKQGLLQTVFLNGKLVKFQTLAEIRERLKNGQH